MGVGEGWEVPAEEQGWSDFTWWKIPGSKVLTLVMTCDMPVWYSGHYVKGRMRPCAGEGCKDCSDGIAPQIRYVITGADPVSRRCGLLEVGRTVALQLRDMADRNGGMRGMTVEISKASYSKNSRMQLYYVEDFDCSFIRGVIAPDIKTALRATWEKAGFDIPEGFRRETNAISLEDRSHKQKPVKGHSVAERDPRKAESGSMPAVARFKPPTGVR